MFRSLFSRWLGAATRPPNAAWIEQRLSSPCFYSSLPRERVIDLCRRDPARAAATIAAAERLLRHEFDLLGSGAFVPLDPDRPARQGYQPIDWYLDPIRALRFPRGIPHKAWKLYEMRPGNADVKYPWELARCQHWATLGQAYRLTGDERFAVEVARELDDFVEANPVGLGINWTCTMDVALRAVNWAIGLELVSAAPELEGPFWNRAYAALFHHGGFIRGNLENAYEVTSNHFLSNVAGLWFLGAVFADLPPGREWLAFARQALEQEIDVQVLADGADYESSVPYHRLVAELLLACLRLSDFAGRPLSDHFRSRVRDMVWYLASVVRPDGLMPQVGDADDGRLHVFTGYGEMSPQDPRHLFGPAGAVFDVPEWRRLAGDAGAWESAWWSLDFAAPGATEAPRSVLFRDAGVAIMRAGATSCLVTNGVVGTRGFGNHKHNDQLSFEYHHDGVPVIVDPGSYVYTSDFSARNRLRGTALHNTLEVDGVEQNEMRPDWLFRLFECAHPEHVAFTDERDSLTYVGRHHGYERLSQPVTHERLVRLSKRDGSLAIVDHLEGSGEHDLHWHFHLAPGVSAACRDRTSIGLLAGGRAIVLYHPEALTVRTTPDFYSPSYGLRVPAVAIDLTVRAVVDGVAKWEFRFDV